MKKVFVAMACLCVALTVTAQSNGMNPKFSLEIRELTYKKEKMKTTAGDVIGNILTVATTGVSTDTHHEHRIPDVNAAVADALNRVRRFVPVDGLQEGEEGFVVTGEVTKLSTTQQSRTRKVKEKDKTRTVVENFFSAQVHVSLTLTHGATGETYTKSFNVGGSSGSLYSSSSYGSAPTAEKALDNAIGQLGTQVANYYNNLYPLQANIVERGEEKKDKMKEVYIDLGSADNIAEKTTFYVYVIKQVAGREVKSEIGTIRVEEVMGFDISRCDVRKGSKDIKRAMDEGQKLVVICKD